MTSGSAAEMTFVVGVHVFTVRTTVASDARTAEVTVKLDGREWRYEEPGWRPMALGVASGVPYLWSARGLVVLPVDSADEPEVVRLDEDLLLVFRIEAGWLVVCETSIRLVVDGHERARVEIGEVVERATWNGHALTACDARGLEYRIRVDGTRLVL